MLSEFISYLTNSSLNSSLSILLDDDDADAVDELDFSRIIFIKFGISISCVANAGAR